MKNYSGNLLTSESPSGNLLQGTQTRQEKKDEKKEYKKKQLNETK